MAPALSGSQAAHSHAGRLGWARSVALAASVLVLAVPADRLEIRTPSCDGVRSSGFEPDQMPLAATIGPQTLRPLGVAAFGLHLTAGRPAHPAPRRLREFGLSVNGLVLRWHCSTASALTRATKVRATATVPCVALRS